ncbi:MAG: hypothetical protein JSU66_11120 [Deltaproteobacteria bacterium]|nr:MAG: hypothetical protein JSU66_11120 [Deltaproteobacteria bacterium]
MAETLREVGAEREPAAVEDAEPGAPPQRPRRWLGAVVVLLFLIGGLWIARQAQQNRALEARVADLQVQLESARVELQAYRDRLTDVRSRVSDLRIRIAELEELVQLPPSAPPMAPADD